MFLILHWPWAMFLISHWPCAMFLISHWPWAMFLISHNLAIMMIAQYCTTLHNTIDKPSLENNIAIKAKTKISG